MILLLFLFVLAAAAGPGDDGTVASKPTMKKTGREFVVTGVFDGVSSMKLDVAYSSSDQKHFGVQWDIRAYRNPTHLGLFLVCHNHQERDDKKWSIEVSADFKILGAGGNSWTKSVQHIFEGEDPPTNWGWKKFIQWDEMLKSFVSTNTLFVEVRVMVLKMTGIGNKNLMSFDEDRKQFSDVVLVVDGQKFHVLKLFLASQSSFFGNLFLRDSEESKTSEIRLFGIDSYDFQYFLELLHGEYSIDDHTIDGIVHLADKYNATLATQKCEKFLIEKSRKQLKEKFDLAYRYSLENLRDHCLSKITSGDEIRYLLKSGTSGMDPFVVAELLQKTLLFQLPKIPSEPKIVANTRKEFLLTGRVPEVSSMTQDYFSSIENHFGVQWNIQAVRRKPTHLGLYLGYGDNQEKDDKKWPIEVSADIKLLGPTGGNFTKNLKQIFDGENLPKGFGWHEFIRWDSMMESFVSNNTLTIEVRVKIRKIGKKKLMSFDEDRKNFSDVVLVVDGQKFHVSKLFLASQSPFFENLFLRDSEESEKSEIRLSDIDSYDFQNFLELLHGESPIDDSTIDGIVHLAYKYNVKHAIQKCEKFLIENSGKELKEKFELAYRYSLNSLRDHCLSKITSEAEIRSLMKSGTSEIDPFVVAELLQKSLDFNVKQNKDISMLLCSLLFLFLLLCSYLFWRLSRRSNRS